MKDEDVKMSSKIEKLIKKSIKQQKKLTKNIQDMKTNVPNVIKAANEKPDKDYSNLEGEERLKAAEQVEMNQSQSEQLQQIHNLAVRLNKEEDKRRKLKDKLNQYIDKLNKSEAKYKKYGRQMRELQKKLEALIDVCDIFADAAEKRCKDEEFRKELHNARHGYKKSLYEIDEWRH